MVASLLFDYDFESYSNSDIDVIKSLETDITNPWRQKLYLMFIPRLGREDDLDLQGYSIIHP